MRDLWGQPLVGATVSDGAQSVLTDAAGNYELEELQFGTYELRASHARSELRTRSVGLNAVSYATTGPPHADFSLPFRTYVDWNPNFSTVTGNNRRVVTVYTGASNPGVSGEDGASCVYVRDNRTSSVNSAQPGELTSPLTPWHLDLGIPDPSDEGVHSISYWAEDCGDYRLLTDIKASEYRIDNSPALLSDPAPSLSTAAGVLSVDTDEVGTFSSLVDPAASEFLIDGAPVPGPYWAQLSRCCSLQRQRVFAAFEGLHEGDHLAVVTIRDRAGNASTTSFSFTVDDSAPQVLDRSPFGATTDRTPRLSARLIDQESGVVTSTITLSISDGLRQSVLPHTYDASSGSLIYDVPQLPESFDLGRGPLLDGTYLLQVRVRDLAGNETSVQWQFDLRTLALD